MTTVPDPANPFSLATGGGAPTASSYGTVMLTALVRLHHALQEVRLPLELPGVAEQRTGLKEMVDQLEDYVIPRVTTLEAPLLAVVGGSTGAGKSTLVNSLVGRKVTQPGLLRPTTRSPVLVHHPDDAAWFGADRLLPDLERVDHATTDPAALQLVADDAVPPGLAILDAGELEREPDLLESVVQPDQRGQHHRAVGGRARRPAPVGDAERVGRVGDGRHASSPCASGSLVGLRRHNPRKRAASARSDPSGRFRGVIIERAPPDRGRRCEAGSR